MECSVVNEPFELHSRNTQIEGQMSRCCGRGLILLLGSIIALVFVEGCSKPAAPPASPAPVVVAPPTTAPQAPPPQAAAPPAAAPQTAAPQTAVAPANPVGTNPTDPAKTDSTAASKPAETKEVVPGRYQVEFSGDGHFAVSGGKNATVRMYDVDKGLLVRTFSGQKEAVTSIAFRPDASMIATGSADGNLMVWDAKSVDGLDDTERNSIGGDERIPMGGHKGPIRSLAFRPDGREIASGGEDGTIRYWKLPASLPETIWTGSSSVVKIEAVPQANHIVAGKSDGSLELWDLSESKTISLLPENSNAVTVVSCSFDGKFAAMGDETGKVRVVDLESRKMVLDRIAHEGEVTAIKFHPKRQQLISTGSDGTTQTFDLQTNSESTQSVVYTFQSKGKVLAVSHTGSYAAVSAGNTVEVADLKGRALLHSLPVDGGEVVSLAWSAEDRMLLAGDSNGGLHSWRMPGGQRVFDSRIQEGAIRAVAGSGQDPKIASGGVDGKIRIWHQPGLPEVVTEIGKAEAAQMAVSPNGQWVALGAANGSVRIIDADKKNTSAVFPEVGKPASTLAWSPDGEWLACGTEGGILRVWNVPQGVGSLVTLEAGAPITQVAFHQTGPTVVAALKNGEFKTWKVPFQKTQTLSGHTDTITSVIGNRSGTQVFTAGNDHICRLFDIGSGRQTQIFEGAQDGITSLVLATDETWLAAGDRSGKLSVWKTETGELSGSVQAAEASMTSVAGSPSNKVLASASIDGLVRIWQLPFMPPVQMKETPHETVVLAISPNGKRIATGLADSSIMVRDAQTGEQIQILTGHSKEVTALGWSIDSSLVVSGSLDESVGLWRVSDGERMVKWEGHSSAIRAVAVSANSEELKACSVDGRLAAYTRATNQERVVLKPQQGLTAVAVSPSGKRVALAAADGSVQLFNTDSGESMGTTAPSESVKALAWSADDVSWVSFDAGRKVKYWKLATLEPSRGWTETSKNLVKLCMSSDGSRLLGATTEGVVRLWDAEGHVLQRLPWESSGDIQALALSDDGQLAVAASADGTIMAFPTSLVRAINAHSGQADVVRFSDDRTVITAGADQVISAWNLENGTQLRQFEGCPARVIEMIAATAASKLIVLGDNKKLYAWNLSDGTPIDLTADIRDLSFRRMSLNSDGKRLALLDDRGQFKIVQVSDMREVGEMASPVTDATSMTFLKNGAIVCSAESLAFVAHGEGTELGHKAHEGAMTAVVAVPNKDEIITAGEDGKIKSWSLSGEPIRTLVESESPIRLLTTSEDGTELVSLSSDNRLKSWNSAGESIGKWPVTGRLRSLQYYGSSPKTVVTSVDNQFRMFQSAKGKLLQTLVAQGKVSASATSSGRRVLYVASDEGNLIRYSMEPMYTIDAEQRELQSLAFSKNGGSLASGGEDGSVCVWKLPNPKLVSRLKGHTKPVTAVAFGREESFVVSMSTDKTVRTWNVPEAKPIQSMSIPALPQSISISADDKSLAVATNDKNVPIFDLQSGKQSQSVATDGTSIFKVHYTGKGLMTLGTDKRLCVSDTSAARQFRPQDGPLTGLDIFQDGSYFVTAGPQAGVKLFDFNGKMIAEFQTANIPFKSVSISADGLWLAGTSSEGSAANTLTIWNVAERKPAQKILLPLAIQSAVFEPESSTVLVVCDDRQMRRYRAIDGALLDAVATIDKIRLAPTFHSAGEIITMEGDDRVRLYQPSLLRLDQAHTGAVTSLTYSNNGNFLFSGGVDGRAVGWEANNDKPSLEFEAGGSPVNEVHLPPNQENLIVTYADDAVRVWPLKRKVTEPDVMFAHKAPVRCARTSSDSALMATGGADKIVHLWQLATGRELVQFHGHEAAVNRVVIAPDNKSVISFGDEDAIRVWKIPEDATTSKSIGQVNKSSGTVAVMQPQDAEIDALQRRLSAPGIQTADAASQQRRLDELRSGRSPEASASGASGREPALARIDREIQLAEKKIRTSTGQNKAKLQKELIGLKRQKQLDAQIANASGSKQAELMKELEKIKSGNYDNVTLDEEYERVPGIEKSLKSFKTDFVFDFDNFRPVRLAISADDERGTVGVGRESMNLGYGKLVPGGVQIWDVKTGVLLRSWKDVPIQKLSSITFSDKEKFVYTLPDVSVFQTLTGTSQLLANNACIAVSPGKETAAIGMTAPVSTQVPILKFVNTTDFTFQPQSVNGYEAKVTAIAFAPDGKSLYYAVRESRRHSLFEMDVQDKSKVQVIEEFEHAEPWHKLVSDGMGIEALCVSSDNKQVVSYGHYGNSDYRLTIWHKKSGTKWEPKFPTYKQPMAMLRNNEASRMWIVKDRPTLCLEDTRGTIQTFDISNAKPLQNSVQVKQARWGKSETARSEDGAWFVAGDDSGRIDMWDMRELKQAGRNFKAHSGPIVGIALSANGDRIVSAGEENLVKVWEPPKKSEPVKKNRKN